MLIQLLEPIAQEWVIRKAKELLLKDRSRVVEKTARSEEVGLLERRLELRNPALSSPRGALRSAGRIGAVLRSVERKTRKGCVRKRVVDRVDRRPRGRGLR